MRKILLGLLVLISIQSFSQSNYVNILQRYRWVAGKFDSTLHVPFGTTASLRTGGHTGAGALFFRTTDSSLYVWTGFQWTKTGASAADFIQNQFVTKQTGNSIYDTARLRRLQVYSIDSAAFNWMTLGGDVTNVVFKNGKTATFRDRDTSSAANDLNPDELVNTNVLVERLTRLNPVHSTVQRQNFVSHQVYETESGGYVNPLSGNVGAAILGITEIKNRPGIGDTIYMLGGSPGFAVPTLMGSIGSVRDMNSPGDTRIHMLGAWSAINAHHSLWPGDSMYQYFAFRSMGYANGTFGSMTQLYIPTTNVVGQTSQAWGIYNSDPLDINKNLLGGQLGVGTIDFGTHAIPTFEASAQLQINSTTRGFLAPRMTAVQRAAISSPATGLMVWDTDSLRYMGYNGSAWKGVAWTGEAGGGGGGSGTVNSGASLKGAYYPSAGTTVDDWVGIEFNNTNINTKIIGQSITDVDLVVDGITGKTANLQDWKVNGGTLTSLTKDGYMHLPLGTTSAPALKLGSGTSGISGSAAGGIWFFTNTGAWTHIRDGNMEMYPNSTSNFISRGGSSVSAAISARLYLFDAFTYQFGEDGAAPSDQTIQGPTSTGTNTAAKNFLFKAPPGSGNADASGTGEFRFKTADPAASGTGAQSFTDKFIIGKAGYVTGNNRAVTYAVGGTVHVNATDVSNVGTGADDLMTYTVPANALVNDGDALEVEMAFRTAANANAKKVGVYFGGTLLIELDDFVSLGDEYVTVSLTILRTGSATQDYWGELHYRKSATAYTRAFHGTTTITLTSSAILKGVGEGVDDGDVTQKINQVKYMPYKL